MPKWNLGRRDRAWSTRLADQYELAVAAVADLALVDRCGQRVPSYETVKMILDSTTLHWLDQRSRAGSKDELIVAPCMEFGFGMKDLVEAFNQSLTRWWPRWKAKGWATGWTFHVHPDWLSYSPNQLNGGQHRGWRIVVLLDDVEPESLNRAANPLYARLSLTKQRETFKVEQQQLKTAGIALEAITPAQQVMISAQHLRSHDSLPKSVQNPGRGSAYASTFHFIQLPTKRLEGRPNAAGFEDHSFRFMDMLGAGEHHGFGVQRVVSLPNLQALNLLPLSAHDL